MIDVDKIRGATIQYKGKVSTFFTNGQRYRIGFNVDVESLFTIDDEGDYHSYSYQNHRFPYFWIWNNPGW